jgi:hypothetical protein
MWGGHAFCREGGWYRRHIDEAVRFDRWVMDRADPKPQKEYELVLPN